MRATAPDGTVLWIRQFGTLKTDYGNWSMIEGESLVVVGFAGGAFEGLTNLGGGDANLAILPTAG